MASRPCLGLDRVADYFLCNTTRQAQQLLQQGHGQMRSSVAIPVPITVFVAFTAAAAIFVPFAVFVTIAATTAIFVLLAVFVAISAATAVFLLLAVFVASTAATAIFFLLTVFVTITAATSKTQSLSQGQASSDNQNIRRKTLAVSTCIITNVRPRSRFSRRPSRSPRQQCQHQQRKLIMEVTNRQKHPGGLSRAAFGISVSFTASRIPLIPQAHRCKSY